MDYRVEDLAHAAGVSVDTVRFYQGRGLIPGPRRVGRVAVYGSEHLECIKEIRSRLSQGFSLAQIGRLQAATASDRDASDPSATDRALLEALVDERVGPQTWLRSEFASATGLPEALLAAVESAGLIEPIQIDGVERYTASDVELAKSGMALLEAGLPLAELLAIADTHVRNIRELADLGIDLFDDHIERLAANDDGADGASGADVTAAAFRQLLPEVTRLVALHFQRTLVNRALDRLRGRGDRTALERALEATESGRLEVEWR